MGEVHGVSLRPMPASSTLGRYPSGIDATAEAIAAALDKAGFSCTLDPEVMASKYGKLLMNVANIIDTALPAGDRAAFIEQARA